MPTTPTDLSDDQLLELLRTALAPEPPPHLVDMLMTGYDLRHVDDLVAAMARDSATAEAAGTRDLAAAVRELTFVHEDVTIDVEVAGGGLVGQVIGASTDEIRLVRPGGSLSAPVDELGRFRFPAVDPGPVRLVIVAGGRRIATAWVAI